MIVEQIYTGCLAEAAYYIESDGEVAIVDPLREVAPYLDRAAAQGAKIKYVLETHFHADFVSGHIDLARKTGAAIVFGPTAKPNFEAHVALDGEVLQLGSVTIKVLHTPGHTMESSTYLLIDETGKEHALFTGDTLFIGDVGRPDLAVKSDLTREDLAGLHFDSLRNKIMPLSDELIIFPGHGAGSACGKNMSKETSDTLGNQKLFNYALKASLSREAFIQEVTKGLVEPPQYFPKNALLNKMGYVSIDEVLEKGITPLDVRLFKDVVQRNEALILDTRAKEEFVKAHIPGSVWIGIDDKFAPWVGALITDLEQPIVFLAATGREEEVITRLSRVGYDHALGYLDGGIESWLAAGESIASVQEISAQAFTDHYNLSDLPVLDVRKESEFESQHLMGAINFPLDFINKNMKAINRDQQYYVHCAGGYRSLIAISILKSRGFDRLINVRGGFGEIKKSCTKVTVYHEPETML